MSKNILEQIEEKFPSFTKLQKIAARSILDDPMDSAFSTVEQFSRKARISAATVVRFANTMGYSGYTEFQQAIQEYLRARLNPVKRLEQSLSSKGNGATVLSTFYRNQLALLETVLNDKIEAQIAEAAAAIAGTGHIYTLGSRGSYAIAYYICHHLNRVYKNADILPETGRLSDYLMRIHPGDVVIVVNFPRYNRQLVGAAKIAAALGAKVIVFTDSRFSPYTQHADILFELPCNSNDYHNTLLPAMLVSELLISYTIMKNYDVTRKSLDDLEPLCHTLEVFVDNR